jgi:hypothetical protein
MRNIWYNGELPSMNKLMAHPRLLEIGTILIFPLLPMDLAPAHHRKPSWRLSLDQALETCRPRPYPVRHVRDILRGTVGEVHS